MDGVTPEKLRRAGGTTAKQAAKLRASAATFALPSTAVAAGDAARAVAEGATMGAYTFTELKSTPADQPAPVSLGDLRIAVAGDGDRAAAEEGARVGEIVGRAANRARDLGNRPGN